jgi:hypothetical protein
LPDADQFPPWQPFGNPLMATLTEPACAVGFAVPGLMIKALHTGGDEVNVSALSDVKEPKS